MYLDTYKNLTLYDIYTLLKTFWVSPASWNQDENVQKLPNSKALKIAQLSYQYHLGVEKEKCQKVLPYYNELLDLTALLLKDIGLDGNPISYSYLLQKLIDGGYLSNTKKFYRTANKDLFAYDSELFGLQVTYGMGCCRHLSFLHQDIFKKLGLEGEAFYCSTDVLDPKEQVIKGNHFANLIRYHDTYYVHDLTNRLFFYFENGLLMDSYEKTDIHLCYVPMTQLQIKGGTFENLLLQIRDFSNPTHQRQMNKKELMEIMAYSDHQMKKSTSLLEDYKEEAKTYIKQIHTHI